LLRQLDQCLDAVGSRVQHHPGEGSIDGIVMLIMGTFMIAAPVSLFLGMPFAFWGWRVQQRRSVALGDWSAAAVGFGAGTFLHLAFLMCFGGWLLLPGVLLTTALCGGLYGAVFSFWFSRGGGFGPTAGGQVGAQRR
jgi:hypothetical protein